MRRAYFVSLAVVACSGVASAVQGCSSDEPKGGTIDLPSRDPSKDAGSGTTTPDSGTSTPVDCKSITKKLSDRPSCDTCTKEKCCTEVRACVESSSCDALQACLEPCPQDDDLCILTCITAHQGGADKLQGVGECASIKCKTECPPPDAGDLFDSGL